LRFLELHVDELFSKANVLTADEFKMTLFYLKFKDDDLEIKSTTKDPRKPKIN